MMENLNKSDSGVIVYDDAFPLSEETLAGFASGGAVRVRFPAILVDLSDVLNFDGVDGMNNYLDEITGTSLTDIVYSVNAEETLRLVQLGDINDETIVITAEGDIADTLDWLQDGAG